MSKCHIVGNHMSRLIYGTYLCFYNKVLIILFILGKFYQLVGGSSGHEKTSGRLEVQIAGDWVSVCKDGFDYKAVQALCRELGKG